jgi:hypothetical protein
MADRQRIEKDARKARKKLLKTPMKNQPMAMQPPREGDVTEPTAPPAPEPLDSPGGRRIN